MRRCLRQSARVWVWIALLAAAGCDRSESLPFTSETDEPDYHRGQQLEKTDHHQEALAAFLKVIEKRGEDAPESHLEAGLIYQQDIKDPIAAIYHFRKYIELKPNSPQADLVRQRIDAATRDFARTLPGQPFDNTSERLDLMELVDKLQRENNQLKQALAAANGAVPDAGTVATPAADGWPPASSAPGPIITIHTNQKPSAGHNPTVVAARPASVTPSAAKPSPAAAAKTPAAASTGGRQHTVGQGDTLMKIAQRYYGSRTKWHDIYEANRDVMKNESDLRIGMQLKIP